MVRTRLAVSDQDLALKFRKPGRAGKKWEVLIFPRNCSLID
jgi:hypothetical protein